MKKTIIIGLCIILIITGITNAEKYSIFQETENDTEYSGLWTDTANAYDGSYSSYAVNDNGGVTKTLTFIYNHSITDYITNKIIKARVGDLTTAEYTLPNDCYYNNQTTLYIIANNTIAEAADRTTTLKCYNGTTYNTIVIGGDSSGITRFYESGINWSFSTNNIDINAVTANGTKINNFAGSAYNGTHYINFTSTTGLAEINLTPGVEWTINIHNYEYVNNTYTFTPTGSYENISIPLYYINSITVNSYDLESLSLITTSNTTIELNSNTTYTNITTNGISYINNITPGTYEIKITNPNYTTKYYTITVDEGSHQELNAYLVSNSYSATFRIQDSLTSSAITNASINVEIQNGSNYILTDVLTTDISGSAQLYYLEGEKYKFTITANNYASKVFYLNPILFASYTVSLDSLTSTESPLDYADITITYYPTTFYNNQTQNFSYLISSPTGRLINYTINLTYPGNNSGRSGVNAYGESDIINLNITNAAYHDKVNLTYNYTVSTGGTKSFTISYEITGTGESNNTISSLKNKSYGLGLFEKSFVIMIVLIIIAGFGYLLAGLSGALVLGIIIMGLGVYLGFLPIWSILISVTLAIALIVKNSSGGQG